MKLVYTLSELRLVYGDPFVYSFRSQTKEVIRLYVTCIQACIYWYINLTDASHSQLYV